jgi:type II secretory pathway pseudopilin PulG
MPIHQSVVAKYRQQQHVAGFTLLELFVVIFIVGIMAALIAPGWSAFYNRQRLSKAIELVYQGVRDAAGNARRQRSTWQASIREVNETVQWAIHPASSSPGESEWSSLDSNVELDVAATTLKKIQVNGQNVYKVELSHKGQINGQLGKITLVIKGTELNNAPRRCVITSTLLGHMRLGEGKEPGKCS